MTHAVTIHDSEFTDEDASLAIEWQAEQAMLCDCGHPIDETSNDDNAPAYIAERVTCWACAARDRAARKDKGQPGPGQRWRIRDRSRA